MNTLWHFGDSFGTCSKDEIIFSKYIADYFGINHSHHALGGSSNRTILQSIVRNIHRFNANDMVLVNWSLQHRFDCFIEQNNKLILSPTSAKDVYDLPDQSFYYKEYISWILDGSLKYSKLEQYKLYLIIYDLLTSIDKMGITIYNAYINELDGWKPHLPSKTISFDGQIGKADWITSNGYWDYNKKDGTHYIDGVQERIGKYYTKQIEHLNNTTTDHSNQVDNSPTKLF